MPAPILVGICGGSGSGKTTLCNKIAHRLGAGVSSISQDMYYKDLSYLHPSERNQHNFDHPDALDNDLLCEHMENLKKGVSIEIPGYDFATHTRSISAKQLEPADIILVEGILLLTDSRIRKLLDYTVYLHVDADIRFIRRLKRDIEERGRSVESVIQQYLSTVKPMHDKYVEPSKAYADLVIPGTDLDGVVDKIFTAFHHESHEEHEDWNLMNCQGK